MISELPADDFMQGLQHELDEEIGQGTPVEDLVSVLLTAVGSILVDKYGQGHGKALFQQYCAQVEESFWLAGEAPLLLN